MSRTETPAEPAWPYLHWHVDGQPVKARWRSERRAPPPARIQVVNDSLSADQALRLVREGTGLLWAGDFQNARHLLQALARRVDRPARVQTPRANVPAVEASAATAFETFRQSQARRSQLLAMVLIPMQADFNIPLRRAPEVRLACAQAWGEAIGDALPDLSVVALTELLGVVSAHEWRKKGVEVPSLGPGPNNRIHPHYGVFSPVRGEYVELVANAALPAGAEALALDIGTGSGVLAAVLARRGVRRVLATDNDPRALACARDNIDRLGVAQQVQLVPADLFPPAPAERAALVVCNPPWVPAQATAPIERAIYDEDSRMLRGFLAGLAQHLLPGGEGWLILSDLAEHLGLRTRQALLAWIDQAGLVVLGRIDTRPRHRKATDAHDPLHRARAAEVTSLWRLGALS